MSNRQQNMDVLLLLMGAGESIDLIIRHIHKNEFDLSLDSIANIVDDRLRLRCLLPLPGLMRNRDGSLYIRQDKDSVSIKDLKDALGHFDKNWWDARLIPDVPLVSSLIVDRESTLFYEYLNDPPGPWFSQEPRDVEHYSDQFEVQWNNSYPVDEIDTLYDSASYLQKVELESDIATVSYDIWKNVLGKFNTDSESLRGLDSRLFEELIAELLQMDGFEVSLTKSTRDGGRDILVYNETSLGKHLYLVECKRRSAKYPVGVSVVRQLYGVVAQERATAGLIVTTSNFTKDALSFAKAVKHQLALKDYDALKLWIQHHATNRN